MDAHVLADYLEVDRLSMVFLIRQKLLPMPSYVLHLRYSQVIPRELRVAIGIVLRIIGHDKGGCLVRASLGILESMSDVRC